MKNLGVRSSVILGLGAAALMLTSIACGSSGDGGAGGSAGGAAGAAGGATGSAGAKAPVINYPFDTTGSTQGFNLQTYIDTSQYKNLGALAADAGVPDGGTYPTVTQADGQGQGSPATGALKVTADFTDFQQYIEVKAGLSPPKDLTGTTIHASLNVTSSFYGGAFLYAKSGQNYVYASSTGQNLTSGTFTALTFNLDTAIGANGGMFQPSMIQEIGIHIYSDGPNDGGTFPMPGEYTFYIDNVVAK